jgi:hypothetical protein
MDAFWLFPTANPVINILLRSIVLVVALIFAGGWTLYNAYWVAIVHDVISLVAVRHLV